MKMSTPGFRGKVLSSASSARTTKACAGAALLGGLGLLALPRRQILLEARRVSSRYLEKASVGFRFPKNHP
jgi:hypothetical protein